MKTWHSRWCNEALSDDRQWTAAAEVADNIPYIGNSWRGTSCPSLVTPTRIRTHRLVHYSLHLTVCHMKAKNRYR